MLGNEPGSGPQGLELAAALRAIMNGLSGALEERYTTKSVHGASFAGSRIVMVSRSNSRQDDSDGRRLRFDHFTLSTVVTLSPGVSSSSTHSGRLLVLGAGLVILIVSGSLCLVFRDWRARYRARAVFGATQVAPVIDSLAQIVPPGMDAEPWRRAVQQTHDMLVTVTSANLLDLEQMKALRDELRQSVKRAFARPETSRDELAGVWNAMADRAEFVLQVGDSGRRKGHPRPATLPPRPSKETIAKTGKY